MSAIIKNATSLNVPYERLKDEPKFGPLHPAAPQRTAAAQRYRQQQRRNVGVASFLFALLALIVTLLVFTVVARTILFRCWRAGQKEVEERNFERFLQMLGVPPASSDEPNDRPIPKVFRQPVVFDPLRNRGPGPVRRPADQPARCPALDLIECNRNTFDGYSLREHQERIDLSLGKALLTGALNTSYAVNNARAALRRCVRDMEGDKKELLAHFRLDVDEVNETNFNSSNPALATANIVTAYRQAFGVDSFFAVEVGPNYLAPDQSARSHVLYVNQQPPAEPHSGLMALLRQSFGNRMDEAAFQKLQADVARIRQFAVDSEDSSEWKSFTAAEATARWPFFDFAHYFEQLNAMKKFSNNVKHELVFVVKTPAYLDKLNAFFLGTNKAESEQKVELFKQLSVYNVYAEYAKYLGADEIEDSLQSKYRIGRPDGHTSSSYNFVFTYGGGGHATYESIHFCVRDLRANLPDIASAVLSDLTSKYSMDEEIQRVEGMIEAARNELVELVSHLPTSQSAKSVLMEKVRKIGVSFSTRESVDKDLFEEVHRELSVDEEEVYVDVVADQRNFFFRRQLDRLNSKVEALRSAAFADFSAATVKIEYERIGNWLNIPGALLTAPALGMRLDSPRAVIYSNIVWEIGRVLAKAIDSEGVLYNALGIHRRGEADLSELEAIWTDALACLRTNTRTGDLSGRSSASVLRNTLDEALGFQVAYGAFWKAVETAIGEHNEVTDHVRETREISLTNFFQTSASTYCSVRDRGASMPLLDKFVDSFLKRRNILGCSEKNDAFQCPIDVMPPIKA
ncbi:hypothetical protein M3Y99_01201700 [Aphelenchoides fujianensis]|nr:hypothetical protein M3Y99_01201700 [Aphelenchoides fujianensis]